MSASIGRKSRSACATRCCSPWREASKPILQSAVDFGEDPSAAQLQSAWRDYLLARERAVALRVLALQTGDVSDEARAISADQRLGQALNAVNALIERVEIRGRT